MRLLQFVQCARRDRDGEAGYTHRIHLDFDSSENICAITIEHARERTDIPHFSYEQVAD